MAPRLQSILDGHRPRHAERGPDLDQLRRAFDDLGDPGAAFLAALEKHEPRSAGYHARKILALREGYDTAELLAALAHALAYGALEHRAVERILLARARPRRLDEYVAEAARQEAAARGRSKASTEPRDLAEYDALPCRGSLTPSQGDPPCPRESSQGPDARSSASESGTTSNDSD